MNATPQEESKGVLWRTRMLVIGPMQYADGRQVREYVKQELNPLGITVFDHYNKPFVSTVPEDEAARCELKRWMETEQYDKVSARREIRLMDLNLVDRADIILFHFIPGVVTVGSWEEFFWAVRLKKPIFFVTEGGKKLTPYWVLWSIPHKYIYGSVDEALDVIRGIDSGAITADSARWRLLKSEYR